MSDGTVPKDARAVAFAYNTPPYGKVLVVERLPDVPPEDYDAANHPTRAEQHRIVDPRDRSHRGGAQALVVTDPEGGDAGISWLEGTFEFFITDDNLTTSQMLEIVKSV